MQFSNPVFPRNQIMGEREKTWIEDIAWHKLESSSLGNVTCQKLIRSVILFFVISGR
ncbi:hypothetical protein BC941DRAFT_433260 [Chlamydoabsidia padenii]|nr:hypothetical protein BC941DRAFT_433260 [Chlamydoabsidia padenii]